MFRLMHTLHPDVLADVLLARHALQAVTAGDVHLARHIVTNPDQIFRDALPDLDHFAAELMANHQR
jgi:hypothetical protein